MSELVVYKNRTNTIQINLGYDISGETFESQIKAGKVPSSSILATWDIGFVTDGSDGLLRLRLDDSAVTSALITVKKGYMDLKRISAGEPYPVFSDYLTVKFKETITT